MGRKENKLVTHKSSPGVKKFLLFALFFAFCASSANAQLSQRLNDNQTFRMGNRPQGGDMALVFGVPITNGNAALGIWNGLSSGNLLTFVNYSDDQNAMRMGVRISNSSTTSNGKSDTADFPTNMFEEAKYGIRSTTVLLAPGWEHHYSNKNLFDVYSAIDVLAGFNTEKAVSNELYINGDMRDFKATTRTIQVGAGAVIGISAWISNLPVSVGLEYGWSVLWNLGGATSVKEDIKMGSNETSVEYKYQEFRPDGSPDPTFYESLSRRNMEAETNDDVKVVLRFYFGSDNNKDN
jgi:hypothetical protein